MAHYFSCLMTLCLKRGPPDGPTRVSPPPDGHTCPTSYVPFLIRVNAPTLDSPTYK